MKINFIIFLFSVVYFSCNKLDSGYKRPSNSNSNNNTIKSDLPQKKLLALGDSYTFGASVSQEDRWTNKLIEINNKDYQFVKHQVIAKSGWTTSQLLQAIDEQKPAAEFDLVTLLIGVNNQYQNLSFGLFEKDFDQLVKKAKGFAKDSNSRLIVLSIPDWGASPFGKGTLSDGIAKKIDEYNQFIESYCAKNNVPYVEITSLTRTKTDEIYFAVDRLHYSGLMHQLWAEVAQKQAQTILNK